MRSGISHRILGVASHLVNTRISFDEFIRDVTESHIGLLKATEDLKSVQDLLIRSGHEEPVQRLVQVQKDLDFALETMRVLDALYSTGKLRYGPRAPQTAPKQTAQMEAYQDRPNLSRPSRKLKVR